MASVNHSHAEVKERIAAMITNPTNHGQNGRSNHSTAFPEITLGNMHKVLNE